MHYNGYQEVKEYCAGVFPSCSILYQCCWIFSGVSHIMMNSNKQICPWRSNLKENNYI